jgi:hypothetical protein
VPATQPAWREKTLLPAAGLFALAAGADPQQLSMRSINPPTHQRTINVLRGDRAKER